MNNLWQEADMNIVLVHENWNQNINHNKNKIKKELDFEKARLKDQQRVIKFCDSVVRGFSNQNLLLRFIRNMGLMCFENIPGIKPLVANYAMGLKS